MPRITLPQPVNLRTVDKKGVHHVTHIPAGTHEVSAEIAENEYIKKITTKMEAKPLQISPTPTKITTAPQDNLTGKNPPPPPRE